MAHLLKSEDKGAVLRIIRRDRRLRMQVSSQRPGDQTFSHDGRVVLVLDAGVGNSVATRALELRPADSGPRLRMLMP